jgi:hypothetical protein
MRHGTETLERIPGLRQTRRRSVGGSSRRISATRGRLQTKGRAQPSETRPETETEIPRFPRPCRDDSCLDSFLGGFLQLLAGQLSICQPLADNLQCQLVEPISVLQNLPVLVCAVIESKGLLTNIAKQVKRLDVDVRATQTTLQKRPKIINPVRVNVSLNISFEAVNEMVYVLVFHAPFRAVLVAVNGRFRLDSSWVFDPAYPTLHSAN